MSLPREPRRHGVPDLLRGGSPVEPGQLLNGIRLLLHGRYCRRSAAHGPHQQSPRLRIPGGLTEHQGGLGHCRVPVPAVEQQLGEVQAQGYVLGCRGNCRPQAGDQRRLGSGRAIAIGRRFVEHAATL